MIDNFWKFILIKSVAEAPRFRKHSRLYLSIVSISTPKMTIIFSPRFSLFLPSTPFPVVHSVAQRKYLITSEQLNTESQLIN